ncbi:HAD family phosphatase [uncultured Tessaracoccus sp.]|uniref:HAD family hydrolase n=1 Tax=uncultured Tessaracoccus sp. TaxID=905023 RepID=UPI0025EDE59E|nr:HAD family phosphatase [uncultured Tessaracoccus sp.]
MTADAVIFDLDGTLIDTEQVWDEVRRGLATDAGITWRPEYSTAMMGMSTPEWSRYLSEVVGLPVPPEEAARMTVQGMVDHYTSGVTIQPGAVRAVERMAGEFRVGIASSSPRVLIEAAASEMGITELLDATVSTEECRRGKPAPDGYLAACAALDCLPGRTVAVEDSEPGILSALHAGLSVVAVPVDAHRPSDELLARTTVLGSLDELTVELVRGLA